MDEAFASDMLETCQRLLEDGEVRVRWAVSAEGKGVWVGLGGRGTGGALSAALLPAAVSGRMPAQCIQEMRRLPVQVGELLRTLSERLGIEVWERMRECLLASIHSNFDRDAAEPSGQLPQQDVGSGGLPFCLPSVCTSISACTA